MYRFFVNNKNSNKFILDKETLNHLKAIRLKKNEKFYCIYEKKYFICHLLNNEAIIEKEVDINNEPINKIILFAAIINIKRFEWLIQKAAELGVKEFYPLISKNVNKKYLEQIKSKISRFQEISKNACEQSFRNIIMKINNPITFEEAIKYEIDTKFIAHEKIKDVDKNKNVFFDKNVAFFVGPEGGFEEEEIKKANENSIYTVSLGKRILRAETASIFLLSRIID